MNDNFKIIPLTLVRFSAVVSLVIMSFGVLSSLAYVVFPKEIVYFQWLGLFMPVVIVSLVLLLIYGLWKNRFSAICALIGLVGTFHYFPKVIQFNKVTGDVAPDIRMITYNVRSFRMDYNVPSVQNISEYVVDKDINLICLQEVPVKYTVDDLKSAFPMMKHFVLSSDQTGKHHLAVMSKYPITNAETVSFNERSNCALIVDLSVDHNKFRVFNCHLQTTNLNQMRPKIGESSVIDQVWNMVSVMSSNFAIRSNQVAYLNEKIVQSPIATLVCGDFNDSPVSYTYHTMKGKLKDAFSEAGNGYAYTYRYFRKLIRIDYVFFSGSDFEAINYQTGDIGYSDHLPVIVDFNFVE
jgi:vancomycin resistance protein VanJ